MRAVIDRDEVLHVARLARLRLSDEEVEPMARELSAVLDHIAKIGELDLRDVAPTAHVVADAMPSDAMPSDAMPTHPWLRADEPRGSLPREVALAQAPAVSKDGEGFLVPSPQA
jgi:aspartyl-tRNA(Asn)/glutamyl-tRNA(Gln) amidotransferase subunit C